MNLGQAVKFGTCKIDLSHLDFGLATRFGGIICPVAMYDHSTNLESSSLVIIIYMI